MARITIPDYRTVAKIDNAPNMVAVQDVMISAWAGTTDRDERANIFTYGDRRLRTLGLTDEQAHAAAYEALDMHDLNVACSA